MYYSGGWALAGVVWVVIVIYGLILATRLVRALERVAEALEKRGP